MLALLLNILIFSFIMTESPTMAQTMEKKTFNPDIGINVLSLLKNSDHGNKNGDGSPNGFAIQEIELQFSAIIDPYFRGVTLIGIHPEEQHSEHAEENLQEAESEPDEEEHASYAIEPEEVYVETIAIPYATIKLGKFKAAIGKHNQYHTHAFPFLDAPLSQELLLGEEGLADAGISSSFLIPAPWYVDFTIQAMEDGSEMFSSEDPNNFIKIAQLKNLWDISDELTFEFGLSGVQGINSASKTTQISGADMTWKWRPTAGGNYQSLAWTTEYLKKEENGIAKSKSGLSSWLQYQFARRWWIQFRGEQLQDTESDFTINKKSLLLGFFPSEFSSFRLQYDKIEDESKESENRLSLQFNFSVGAHPAHTY